MKPGARRSIWKFGRRISKRSSPTAKPEIPKMIRNVSRRTSSPGFVRRMWRMNRYGAYRMRVATARPLMKRKYGSNEMRGGVDFATMDRGTGNRTSGTDPMKKLDNEGVVEPVVNLREQALRG